jgi:hypothetical protein
MQWEGLSSAVSLQVQVPKRTLLFQAELAEP